MLELFVGRVDSEDIYLDFKARITGGHYIYFLGVEQQSQHLAAMISPLC